MASKKSVVNIASLLVLIAGGYFLANSDPSLDAACVIVTFALLAGFLFFVTETILGPVKGRAGVVCLLVYLVIFFFLDPICFIGKADPSIRAVPILLLAPIVLGVMVFASKGLWRAWIGSLLVFFGAVFAMTYNILQGGHAGISLIYGTWVRL